ncbi:unnamed protein product [Bursaphelenchus okinawaensis]|uniref:Uncharacterized protein n=1 Tax=Bursaphelenchus okinawaensis TaxID=465554 RepID=A0A811LP51_9BILA|nr:unnamed protein product [Bursaphelenchus okinawaensis]CAG9126014.1 unnamed protein product [Bursaphelenchus okinawaensis]
MEERSTPPPFEEETTNKADYTGHVVMPQYYDEYAYSDYYYEPEKVPFVETTTHKREFTPKKVTVERRRTQSMEAARPHGIKMESDTTNRHDFTKKSSTCPASHLKLKNGRTENGHIYFVQRKNTGNKKR